MNSVDTYSIIRSPIITEKATLLSESNKIVFKVSLNAKKSDIKSAIEALFDVKVSCVNTSLLKGKVKRFKGRYGRRSDVKRAVVTLGSGYSIDLSAGLN
jgi:large subunit ribosomal protein L23